MIMMIIIISIIVITTIIFPMFSKGLGPQNISVDLLVFYSWHPDESGHQSAAGCCTSPFKIKTRSGKFWISYSDFGGILWLNHTLRWPRRFGRYNLPRFYALRFWSSTNLLSPEEFHGRSWPGSNVQILGFPCWVVGKNKYTLSGAFFYGDLSW